MRIRAVIGVVGAFATLLGAVALLRPAVILEAGLAQALARTVADLDVGTLSLSGVGLVTLALIVSTLISTEDRLVAGDTSAAERFERTLDRSRESTADAGPRTASDFDRLVDRAIAGDEAARDRVRDHLATLAAETLAAGEADDPSEPAARAIATGTWTDDRTAAAFLAGQAGPAFPVRSRLRLWLDPEAERERRIRRTVQQLERLDGDER